MNDIPMVGICKRSNPVGDVISGRVLKDGMKSDGFGCAGGGAAASREGWWADGLLSGSIGVESGQSAFRG
jgi:hypothetical protein